MNALPQQDLPDDVSISLHDHRICCIIPAGSRWDCIETFLPGGVLILGAFRGKLTCRGGSALIAKGAEFQGQLEADEIWIEGAVTSSSTSKTNLQASRQIVVGAYADIRANMTAPIFQIPKEARLRDSVVRSLNTMTP